MRSINNKQLIEMIENFILTDAIEAKMSSIQNTINPSAECEFNMGYNSNLLLVMELMGIDRNDESDIIDDLFKQYDKIIRKSEVKEKSQLATDVFLAWTNSIAEYSLTNLQALTILK